ncbi:MAG: hypothetical protein U9P70_03760 [Patescibacteria group bacterium]|nr:hypothetical protein [Patescibacteria group bacterium]
MKMSKEKGKDLIALFCMLLVTVGMFFIVVIGITSEKAIINSDPIELREEWVELSAHPNRLPTYVWVVKVSEGRNRVENTISFDDFRKKFDNGKIVRVVYVVEHNKIVLYGDEELSPNNIKLWKSVANPEQQSKRDGSVSFSEPIRSENTVTYKGIIIGAVWLAFIGVILFLVIVYIIYDIKKKYEETGKEGDEETRS